MLKQFLEDKEDSYKYLGWSTDSWDDGYLEGIRATIEKIESLT